MNKEQLKTLVKETVKKVIMEQEQEVFKVKKKTISKDPKRSSYFGFYVNDILVATQEVYKDYVRTGNNRLRTKMKTIRTLHWDYAGVRKLFNDDKINTRKEFTDQNAELNWGGNSYNTKVEDIVDELNAYALRNKLPMKFTK